MADFSSVARGIRVMHLGLESYYEAAKKDPDVLFELDTGFMTTVEETRDPVLVAVGERRVTCCPPLIMRLLADEPPELHRPFVEGVFFRKLFRFFVPATHEGAPSWEAVRQVREIMQRHFALQLVAAEAVMSRAA